MTQKKQAKSRIPQFKNRQEMAEWFDSHDIANYQDEFRTVNAKFAKNLSVGLNIRFDPYTLKKLRRKADEKGVGPTTLARMWIIERLQASR